MELLHYNDLKSELRITARALLNSEINKSSVLERKLWSSTDALIELPTESNEHLAAEYQSLPSRRRIRRCPDSRAR